VEQGQRVAPSKPVWLTFWRRGNPLILWWTWRIQRIFKFCISVDSAWNDWRQADSSCTSRLTGTYLSETSMDLAEPDVPGKLKYSIHATDPVVHLRRLLWEERSCFRGHVRRWELTATLRERRPS